MFSNAWVKLSEKYYFPKPGNYTFFAIEIHVYKHHHAQKEVNKTYILQIWILERDRVYARACRLYVRAASSPTKHSFVVRSEPVPPKPSVRRHLDSCDGHRMCSTHRHSSELAQLRSRKSSRYQYIKTHTHTLTFVFQQQSAFMRWASTTRTMRSRDYDAICYRSDYVRNFALIYIIMFQNFFLIVFKHHVATQ